MQSNQKENIASPYSNMVIKSLSLLQRASLFLDPQQNEEKKTIFVI